MCHVRGTDAQHTRSRLFPCARARRDCRLRCCCRCSLQHCLCLLLLRPVCTAPCAAAHPTPSLQSPPPLCRCGLPLLSARARSRTHGHPDRYVRARASDPTHTRARHTHIRDTRLIQHLSRRDSSVYFKRTNSSLVCRSTNRRRQANSRAGGRARGPARRN
jgi:hypothetical protein